MSKLSVLPQSSNSSMTIVGSEVASQQLIAGRQPTPKVFNTVSINSDHEPLAKTRQDDTVGSDCRKNINTLKVYEKYRETFLEMLEPLQHNSHGHR